VREILLFIKDILRFPTPYGTPSGGIRVHYSLRFIAPITIGALLIWIAISTIRYGGKRESLGAFAESSLLGYALSENSYAPTHGDDVITISVKDSDLATIRPAPHQSLKDAHIDEYAQVLERIALHNPRYIVISWLSQAHPFSANYLRPLTDVIDKTGLASKTVLAISSAYIASIPEDLSRRYQFAEARDCYYEVNVFCTINPDWTWMPQQLVKAFWPVQKPWTVSLNLPHTLPNFVLHLPDPKKIQQLSFLDFRPPVTAEIKENAVIFIGNDSNQDLHYRNNKEVLQKTFVASSHDRSTLMSDGIPYHVFWASMSMMFLDQRQIEVAPVWLCNTILAVMLIAILAAIRVFRGLALGPFLICAISLPLANVIGVKYAQLYVPVVPIITGGFAIFVAAAFFSVAAHSYTKWRLEALGQTAQSTSDIKENFISLISHNLNTPIAQLRGLIDILIRQNASSDAQPHLTQALRHLEIMRIVVKAVLETNSLNKSNEAPTRQTLRQLWSKFEEQEGPFLRRMGLTVTANPPQDDSGEVWYYRFGIPETIFRMTLQFAFTILNVDDGKAHFIIEFHCTNDDAGDPGTLSAHISLDDAPGQRSPSLKVQSDFVKAALSRYFDHLRPMGITVDFSQNQSSKEIKISFLS
jgi:hypothetical protein